MNTRHLLACLFGMPFVWIGAPKAQAQDIRAIIDKTNAVYTQMKTMQVLLDTEIRSGNQLTGRSLTDAKTIANTKTSIRIRPQTKSNGIGSKDLPNSMLLIVDDGKVSWLLQEAQHRYIRRAHVPTAFQTILHDGFGLPFNGLKPDGVYTLGTPTWVDGNLTYALEYTPKSQTSVKVSIYIDQKSYHIRRARVVRIAQPVYSVTTTVRNEVINASIPDQAFVFVPSKGAVEVKPTAAVGADGSSIPTTPIVPGSR